MSKAVNTPRWFAAWRSAPRPLQDDPADLGTAFGLDMSMHDSRLDAAPEPAPHPPGWVQRLKLRRKPAA